jgi:hypothetical protein
LIIGAKIDDLLLAFDTLHQLAMLVGFDKVARARGGRLITNNPDFVDLLVLARWVVVREDERFDESRQHSQGDASTGPSSVSLTHAGKPQPIPISQSVFVRRHAPCDAFLPGVREINGDRRVPG